MGPDPSTNQVQTEKRAADAECRTRCRMRGCHSNSDSNLPRKKEKVSNKPTNRAGQGISGSNEGKLGEDISRARMELSRSTRNASRDAMPRIELIKERVSLSPRTGKHV
jgi:hypothetical protein